MRVTAVTFSFKTILHKKFNLCRSEARKWKANADQQYFELSAMTKDRDRLHDLVDSTQRRFDDESARFSMYRDRMKKL